MKINRATTDRNSEEHEFSTSRKSTKITSGNIIKHSRIYLMSLRCSLKLPQSIWWSSLFHDFHVLGQHDSGISILPVKMGTWRWYHRKERQKILGPKLWMFHLVILSHRYRGPKGVRECQQEDLPLKQFGSPCWPGGECFAPYKNPMVFHWFLGMHQFVWARVFCGTRIRCRAAVDCSGDAQKIQMRKIRWSQGREHAWKCDGFHDPGTFDKHFETLQNPGVRADAQCFKITWLEELASESNTIQAWKDITGQGWLQVRTQENYM